MRTPLVSIVVPAYNRERYLSRTLDSVLAQTLPDWELVVSDDGSTDASYAVAKRYADADARIRVVTGPNGGVAVARNRGFAATDPETSYVTFLDSDDVWEPDALEILSGALQPGHVAAYGLARCIDDEDELIAGDDLPVRMRDRRELRDGQVVPVGLGQPTTFAALAVHNWVVTPGLCLYRRAIAEQVGGFDPSVDPADDWDMAIRMSRRGDIGFVDRPVLRWRRHPDTLTNTSDRWRRAYYRVRRKSLTDPTNTPDQKRAVLACYWLDFGGRVAAARELVSRRQVAGAAREAAKAGDRLCRLLHATMSARMFA